ncbi:asparagine synthase (glutamine-hydrolyzing) [Venturia nashicola]|nr:asparagine synthase (glutamine-hydrolyzing) [Venturia nashicola]
MGHVRLAINDLSVDGEQPFHSSDGQVHAIVNGELYEAEAAREKLSREAGYSFKSRSDCEIVIALYQLYGTSFLRHLRGEFALCLYDSQKKMFLAARDRYGIKPLFYTELDGSLLVAAEVKAFEALGWKAEWDAQIVIDRGYAHDQRTIFKGVKKVRPGCYFTCNASGYIDHQSYWDLEYPDKFAVETRTEEDLILGVRERLLEAVRIRLQADVRVGIFLSGGIDSSVIAGMVAHLVKEEGVKYGNEKDLSNIHCQSVGFDEDSGYDESSTWHNEYPMPDLNYIGKFVLSDAPKEHGVKVVLTGEGADEHFAGYPMFLSDYLAETDHSWKSYNLTEEERQNSWTEARKASAYFFKIDAATQKEAAEKRNTASEQLNNITTLSAMGAKLPDIFGSWVSEFGDCDIQQTMANNVSGRVRDLMTDKWHPLHTAEYMWTKGFLANAILSALGDRAEMAHSLEARPPFLDHHLTEYVNQLPPSVKIRWDPVERRFSEKWILREVSKPFITQEIFERKKHPYSAPPSWPANGPLHKLFSRLVTRENIERLGFVDWDRVSNTVSQAFDDGNVSSFRLAASLAQWVVLSQKFRMKQAQASA